MVNTYLWLNTHTELGLPVVCIVGGTTLPPTIQTSVFTTLWNYNFTRSRHIALRLCDITNFKVLFPVVSTDFPHLVLVKS